MERFRSPSVRRVAWPGRRGDRSSRSPRPRSSSASSRTGCGIPNASATYLLAVVAMAVAFGIPAAVGDGGRRLPRSTTSCSSSRPARWSSRTREEWLNLLLLLVLGVVVGQLAGMQRARAEAALLRERQALAQYRVGRELATSVDGRRRAARRSCRLLQSEIGATRAWIALGTGVAPERVVADSGTAGRPASARRTTSCAARPATSRPRGSGSTTRAMRRQRGRIPDVECYRVPIACRGRGPRVGLDRSGARAAGTPGRGDTRVLAAAADQIGQALERDRLAEEATSAEIARRSEAAKTALLDSVSHDLRTPLASIRAAAGSLMDPALDLDAGGPPRARGGDRPRGGAPQPARHEPPRHEPDRGRRPAGAPRAVPAGGPRRDDPRALGGAPRGSTGHRRRCATTSRPWRWTPCSSTRCSPTSSRTRRATRPRGADSRPRRAAVDAECVRLTIEDGGPGVPPDGARAHLRQVLADPRCRRRLAARGRDRARGGPRPRRGDGRPRRGRTSELGGLAIDVDLRGAAPAEADAAVAGPRPGDDRGIGAGRPHPPRRGRRRDAARGRGLPRAARLPGRRGRGCGDRARALGGAAAGPGPPRPRPSRPRRLGRDPARAPRRRHADRGPVGARPGGGEGGCARAGRRRLRDEAVRRGRAARPPAGRPPTRGRTGGGPTRRAAPRRPGDGRRRATR